MRSRRRHFPPIGSTGYHLLLAAVAALVLGPLAGISVAYMNFSIGFFSGGSVLAGILGSAVTLPYGAEGRHGANYLQTMAASVSGMCAAAVLLQAMVWMGLPQPPAWQLVLYLVCIGMFGVGLGMMFTPLLVDRMRLPFPSGLAVANILRTLSDPALLRRALARLGGGVAAGYAAGVATLPLPALDAIGLSPSTLGAGMIVGARIAIPALVVAGVGCWERPHLVRIGWLAPGEPYRQVGYLISLGMILGSALVDVALILAQAVGRRRPPEPDAADWKRVNRRGLTGWVLFWGAAIVGVGSWAFHLPPLYLTVAVLLCVPFVFVNGISLGLSDWSHISSAFVLTVILLSALGLRQPGVGLLCAAVVLIACNEGCDMQQDRSTGWRLGTNRVVQFRYQAVGIAVGAVLAVVLAKVFLQLFPVLGLDQFSHPRAPGTGAWQSAMTYKFVGILRELAVPSPRLMPALRLGLAVGFAIEVARKFKSRSRWYRNFAEGSRTGRLADFLLDAVLLPSPYASSFGGFVELSTVMWWTAGGVLASLGSGSEARERELSDDMSTASLIGGGLIVGDSLAALSIGLAGLIGALLRGS